MLSAVIAEDCDAVVADELASLLRCHDAAPTRAHPGDSMCAESTKIPSFQRVGADSAPLIGFLRRDSSSVNQLVSLTGHWSLVFSAP